MGFPFLTNLKKDSSRSNEFKKYTDNSTFDSRLTDPIHQTGTQIASSLLSQLLNQTGIFLFTLPTNLDAFSFAATVGGSGGQIASLSSLLQKSF